MSIDGIHGNYKESQMVTLCAVLLQTTKDNNWCAGIIFQLTTWS